MNCPHHHRIFAAEPRSYRDLPLRLAEYGLLLPVRAVGRTLRPDARALAQHERRAHLLHAGAVRRRVQRGQRDVPEVFQDFRPREIRDALQHQRAGRHGQEVRGRAGVVETDRGHGARRSQEQRHQLRRGGRTKRRSTARRSTCRSGAPSAASSPSRPTRWTSPSRNGSASCTRTATTPRRRRSASIARRSARTNGSSVSSSSITPATSRSGSRPSRCAS